MNNKFKTYFSAVIILAIMVGARVFIFKEKINKPAPTVPSGPIESKKVEAKNTIPNLDRQIVVKAELPTQEAGKVVNEIQDLSLTLKQTPDYLPGWLQLGILRKFIGDYAGAIEAWKYASMIRPNEPIAYNNLGDVYSNYLHNPKQAEIYMKKAIEFDPGEPAMYRNLHDLYYFSFKEKDKAIGVLLQGLEKNPDNTNLMVILAGDYRSKGDLENARTYYHKALALNPPNKAAILQEMQGL